MDNGKIVSTRKEYIDEFVHTLMQHVTKAKVLWQYSRFLGMDVEWIPEDNQVLLSQKTYIEQKGWVQSTSKDIRTPMLNTVNLRTAKSKH